MIGTKFAFPIVAALQRIVIRHPVAPFVRNPVRYHDWTQSDRESPVSRIHQAASAAGLRAGVGSARRNISGPGRGVRAAAQAAAVGGRSAPAVLPRGRRAGRTRRDGAGPRLDLSCRADRERSPGTKSRAVGWTVLRPDQMLDALRKRVQHIEETNLECRLAASMSDEAVATTHVRMALETAEGAGRRGHAGRSHHALRPHLQSRRPSMPR